MARRVLLVYNHSLVMQGLSVLLETAPGVELIGRSGAGQEMLSRYQQFQPEVVIMNLALHESFIINTSRHLLEDNQNAKLIGLTGDFDLQLIQEFLKIGASGCLAYDCEFEELVEAIEVVAEGGFHLCPKISSLLINEFKLGSPTSNDRDWAVLTDRERSILLELLGSKAVKEIAADLSLSANTIYVLKRRIMKKMGARSIAELTKLAIRDGVLPV